MEKVTQIPNSPMDVFLLPVWVHKKISIRLQGLLLAFAFVGAFDLLTYEAVAKEPIFTGDVTTLFFKLVFFALMSLVLGAIDVVCTMYPIADFARMIGRRSEKFVNKRIHVIMMKSYALSHLLFVIPTAIYLYSGIEWEKITHLTPGGVKFLFAVIIVLIEFLRYFQLGVLYRTFSVRTRLQVFGKLILILASYFWMEISGTAVLFFRNLAVTLL